MTQPLPPATPIQSAAQSPSDGALMPQRVPLLPSSAPVSPIPSSQQLTSDPRVAAGVQADAFRDQATMVEQMARYFGDARDSAAQIAKELKDAASHVERTARATSQHATRAHGASSSATPYHPNAPQPHGAGSGIYGEPTGARPPLAPSAASTGDVDPAVATMPEGAPGPPSRFEEGYSQWQGMQAARWNNLADARMSAARFVNRRVSTWGKSHEVVQDEAGNYREWDEHAPGNLGRQLDPEAGAARLRTSNRVGQVTDALTRVSKGEATVTGALAESVPYAGAIGGAFAAAHYIQGQVVNQRAENQYYQQIYGGSNASQYAQRGQEQMFGMSQMFGMGSGQARQLFRGVSELGIQGDQRHQALNFATDQFYQNGMSIAQSLELIGTAINGGVQNFQLLSDSIGQVSKAAEAGGRSVAEATRQYSQTFAQLTPTLGGTTAATVAGNLTAVTQALPRELGNVNLAGLGSADTLRYIAAANGMSYSATLGRSQGPGGADWLAQRQQAMLNARIGQSMDPNVYQAIVQRVRGAARGGVLTAGEAQGVGSWALQHGLNADEAAFMAQSLGITGVTPGNVGTYIAEGIATQGFGVSRQADAQERLRQRIRHENVGLIGGHRINPGSDIHASSRSGVVGVQEMALAGDLGLDRKTYTSQYQHGGTEAHDLHYYAQDYVQKTGRRSKVLEDLLAGGNYDPSRRFTVQTKDGLRNVDMHTAIEHYSNQLIQGDVEISAGKGSGQTVAAFTGLANSAQKTYGDRAAAHGSKVEAGGGSGAVRIYPAPELQNILRFSASGGAYIDDARTSGVPADAFPPTNDMPSATGSG